MPCLATFVFFVAFVFVTWLDVWLDEWLPLELELVLAAPDTGNASTRTSTNPAISLFMPFHLSELNCWNPHTTNEPLPKQKLLQRSTLLLSFLEAHPIHGSSLGGSRCLFAAF